MGLELGDDIDFVDPGSKTVVDGDIDQGQAASDGDGGHGSVAGERIFGFSTCEDNSADSAGDVAWIDGCERSGRSVGGWMRWLWK